MKKLFCLLIIGLMWPLTTGFAAVGSTTAVYNGKLQEQVSIEYGLDTAVLAGVGLETLNLKMQEIGQALKEDLALQLATKISALENVNVEEYLDGVTVQCLPVQLEDGQKISIVVDYAQKKIWDNLNQDLFQGYTQPPNEVTAWTIKTTVVSPLRLTMFETPYGAKNLQEYVYDGFVRGLKSAYPETDSLISSKYIYSYATTFSRLYSDADEVIKHSSGLIYHCWEFDAGQPAQITLWQIVPNATIWYVLSLGATAVLGVGLFAVSKILKRKKAK